MMPLIRELEALDGLDAHLFGLRGIVEGGWDDCLSLFQSLPELRVTFTRTTRANVVHDFQIARAAKYAQSTAGVRLEDRSRLKLLVINDTYAIRFKKLDEDKKPSNHLTDQVRDFRGQYQLPGLPPTHNLEMGYVLDKTQSSIDQVCLVCPNGPISNYWANDLLVGQEAQQGIVLDIFEQRKSEQLVEEEEEALVRAKRDGVIIPIRREIDEN